MTPFTRFYWKLYARCVACIAFAAALACVAIIWLVDQETRETGEEALRATTSRAVELARPFLEGRSNDGVVKALNQLAENTQTQFTVAGRNGSVLLDTARRPETMGNIIKRPEIHAARVLGSGLSTEYLREHDQLAAYAALPVYGGDGAMLGFVRGYSHIPVRYAAAQGDRKSDLLALTLIGGLALALAVLPVLGTYFTFRRMA